MKALHEVLEDERGVQQPGFTRVLAVATLLDPCQEPPRLRPYGSS